MTLKIKKPTLNKTKVLKVIGAILLAALLAGAAIATTQHYATTRDSKVAAQKAEAAKQAAAVAQKEADTAAYISSIKGTYEKVRMECEKRAGAYNALTASQRNRLPTTGSCGPAEL